MGRARNHTLVLVQGMIEQRIDGDRVAQSSHNAPPAARIREAVREPRRFRHQQKPRRFRRIRSQHHRLRLLPHFPLLRVEINHTVYKSRIIHRDLTDITLHPYLAASRLLGERAAW